MIDWQIGEDDEREVDPRESSDVATRSRLSRRGVGLVLAVLAVAVILVGLVLRVRLAERQAAMRADLSAFIEQEERARLLGLADRVPDLLASSTADEWRANYIAQFEEPDVAAPTDVELEAVDWETGAALATVQVNGVSQRRYYQLTSRGWRRAAMPLARWGQERELTISEGLRLRFREQDESFAQGLASDLGRLIVQLDEWPRREERINYIEIVPGEFRDDLVRNREGLRVNSPALVSLDDPLAISGESMIRLAIGTSLTEQAGPDLSFDTVPPGARRFLAAIRVVTAVRWALVPAEQNRLREYWQNSLKSEWQSPFFSTPRVRDREAVDFRDPSPLDAATLLMADNLYDDLGNDGIISLLTGLETAVGWDSLFLELTGRYTAAIEANVFEKFLAGAAEGSESVESFVAQPPSGPVRVTIMDPADNSGTGLQLTVRPDGADQSIVVETRDAWVSLPDGSRSPGACAALYRSFDVEGDWPEAGRLRATRITVSDPVPATPPILNAPPDDTQLFASRWSQRSAAAPMELELIAVQPDGDVTQLALSTPSYHFWLLPTSYDQPALFLLANSAIGCSQVWITLYDAREGVVDQWLVTPPTPVTGSPAALNAAPQNWQAIWRSDPETVYLISPGSSVAIAEVAGPELITLTPAEILEYYYIGWSEAAQGLVGLALDLRDIAIWNPTSDRPRRSIPLEAGYEVLPARFVDHRLFFGQLARSEESAGSLRQLDLRTGEITDVLSASERQFFWPADMDPQTGELLVVTADASVGSEQPVTELLAVDPAGPDRYRTLFQANLPEGIANPLYCSGGRVIYSTWTEDGYQIRLWSPGAEPTSLILSEHWLESVVCR